MPRYDFKCSIGHTREVTFAMADVPVSVPCLECEMSNPDASRRAERIFTVPAAIHFKGAGFYATDVRGTLHRKRRSNVGDDLPREFDHGAARVAKSI